MTTTVHRTSVIELGLAKDRTGNDVLCGQLPTGVVLSRKGPSGGVAQDGPLAAKCLCEEEAGFVWEVEGGGVELNVFQVRHDGRREGTVQAQGQADA